MAVLEEIPRVSLVPEPTPLHPLSRLSAYLGGLEVWCKRDDLTRLALGGNKLRKLEFLLWEALDQGADTIITTGAAQSNHARQTAAAAAMLGLHPVLVLREPIVGPAQGNLLLDDLIEAEVRFGSWDTAEQGMALLEQVAQELREAGRRPYIIPHGGSNPVGALGYVVAIGEIARQSAGLGLRPRAVVFATSSGGTQAGLLAGKLLYDLPLEVVGISVGGPASRIAAVVSRIATGTSALLGGGPVHPEQVVVYDQYIGPGYGRVDARTVEAVRTVARLEGVLLDPVYTGKAMAGLIDLSRQGVWKKGERVIFLHTGGLPALFAYGEALGVRVGLEGL